MDRGTWWATIYRISESDMTEWQSRHTHLQFSVPHNFASDFYLLSNIQQVFLPPQSISLCLALNFIFPHGTSYILPCTRQTACLLHLRWSEVLVAQSFLTLCDPMDWSLLGSSVHGTLQARTLEQVAISFSRRSSWPRDRTHVSCTAGGHFTVSATREALWTWKDCETLESRGSRNLFFIYHINYYDIWNMVSDQYLYIDCTLNQDYSEHN